MQQRSQELVEQEHIFEKRKNYYHRWVARLQSFEQESQEIVHKKNLSFDEQNPCCPLCEQNLSAARKRFLHTKLIKMASVVDARIGRLKKHLVPLKELLVAQHPVVQALKADTQKLVSLQTQQEEYSKAIVLVQQRMSQLQTDHAAVVMSHAEITAILLVEKVLLDTMQEHKSSPFLAKEEYAGISDALTVVIASIEDIQEKQKRYAHMNPLQQLQALSAQQKEMQDLALHVEKQAERFAQFIQMKMHIKELRASIIQKEQAVSQKRIEQKQLQEQVDQLAVYEEDARTQATHKERILIEQAALHKDIMHKREMGAKAQALEGLINEHQLNVSEYQVLAQAFSKDGIQALLIEDVIPEIEQEANALLAQLTHNQAHISIESLRDLKKGGTKETLDINISDALGVRPYEMFSGGEAFRIDFALRIAIAKLLARRAGASLQTLIIDEGFGSQDEEGLSLLMDGIHKIQDNFAKIIIVSHLPSMKEQFPVHFMISKGPGGSVVNTFYND